MKLSKLIKKINKENTPPDGWRAANNIKKDNASRVLIILNNFIDKFMNFFFQR